MWKTILGSFPKNMKNDISVHAVVILLFWRDNNYFHLSMRDENKSIILGNLLTIQGYLLTATIT